VKTNSALVSGMLLASFVLVFALYYTATPKNAPVEAPVTMIGVAAVLPPPFNPAGYVAVLMFFIQTAMVELGPMPDWLGWFKFVNCQ
jgi:hypothetical protein